MPRIHLATTIAIALFSVSLPAEEAVVDFKCPERIMTAQRLAAPYLDWRQSAQRPFSTSDEKTKAYSEHNLMSVSFSDGVPEDADSLLADNIGELKGNSWVARWRFTNADNIWVTCEYWQTTVMISKKLPPEAKQCFLDFDKKERIPVRRVWCTH